MGLWICITASENKPNGIPNCWLYFKVWPLKI